MNEQNAITVCYLEKFRKVYICLCVCMSSALETVEFICTILPSSCKFILFQSFYQGIIGMNLINQLEVTVYFQCFSSFLDCYLAFTFLSCCHYFTANYTFFTFVFFKKNYFVSFTLIWNFLVHLPFCFLSKNNNRKLQICFKIGRIFRVKSLVCVSNVLRSS